MVSQPSNTRRRLRFAGVAAVAVLAVVSLVATACSKSSSSGSSGGTVKAAWIYVGPVNDGGWTQTHDAGRKYVETKLGSKVKTTYKENVPEGPEVAQVINDLIKDGNTVIFATSYGFKDAMQAAATANPKVKFEMATGDSITLGQKVASNYNEFYGAGEDSLYITGIAAGKATKNNSIGVSAPFAIPEVIRGINAFTLGAQSVNPAAKVNVVWTKTWFDPAVERKSAESLVAAGVDVLFSHQDSPSAGEVAKAKNIPWFGYDSDQSGPYSSVWQTAGTYNWGPYELSEINKVIDGTWKQNNYYGTIADNFAGLATYGSTVAAGTKTLMDAEIAKAKAGKADAFGWYWGLADRQDQDGKTVITKGQTLTMKDLYTMSYFVKGTTGSPKG